MCEECGKDRCGTEKGYRYWLHIADGWTMDEIIEMRQYLDKLLMKYIGISSKMLRKK